MKFLFPLKIAFRLVSSQKKTELAYNAKYRLSGEYLVTYEKYRCKHALNKENGKTKIY